MTDLPSSFEGDPLMADESILRMIGRRMKEEPLLPLGAGVTCWALYNASKSMKTGNSVQTNRFFRYRLYAQAFTLVAMVGGAFYYKADRFKRKEVQKVIKKQQAQEKNEAWIRELEIRDQEDQEWRRKLGRVKDLQAEEEERLAVLEAKQKKGIKSDKKKALAEARKARMQENNLESIADDPSRPKLNIPFPRPESAEQNLGSKEDKSVLGESEEGGLLGVNRIKRVFKDTLKPALGNDNKEKGGDSNNVGKIEGSGKGTK